MNKRITVKMISSLLVMSFAVMCASCMSSDTKNTITSATKTSEEETLETSRTSETSGSISETSGGYHEVPEGFFPDEPYDADKVHPVKDPGDVSGKDAEEELSAVELEYIRYRMDEDYLAVRLSFRHPEKYGVSAGTPSFGPVGPGDYEGDCKILDGLLERLYKLDYVSLGKQDRDLYEQMVFDIEEERYMTQYPGYKYLVPFMNVSSLGCFYATVGNIDIDNKEQAEEFIVLLSDIDRYFDEICKFEEERSRLGFASVDYYYDKVFTVFYMIQQDSNIKPFREMFEEDISDIKDLSDNDKTRLMEDFDKVMEEVVVPEFKECGQRFKALSGTAVNEKGLAGFPHGKELFEHMIRKEVGRDCDIGKIASGIDSILKEETKDPGMSNIPAGSNQELLDFMEDAADEYFPDIKISYKINKLPRLFKAVGIGGVYYSANYDDNSCERIYLPDEMRQKQVIFHEGVPGHMYQFSYHKNNLDHIYPVLFEQGIYAEGWATYIMCNPAPLYKADMDEDIVYPAPVYKDRMLAARADICLNYEGLSAKETEQYLTGLIGTFSGGLDGVISDPGGSSAYGVGCYETLKTLEAIRSLDPDMSLKTMHKLYLDAGPGCFDRIFASCAREVNRQP